MDIFVPDKEDILQCAKVYCSAYTCTPWEEQYEESEVKKYLEEYLDSDTKRCYAVREGNKILGIAVGFIVPCIDAPYFRVEDFCIAAESHRSGRGSEFINILAKEVAKLGCDSIILGTQKDFPSHRFYLKNGFQEIESVLLYKEI